MQITGGVTLCCAGQIAATYTVSFFYFTWALAANQGAIAEWLFCRRAKSAASQSAENGAVARCGREVQTVQLSKL